LALVKAPIPEFTWEIQDFNNAIYSLTVMLVSFMGFVFISGLILPYSPLGRALVLEESQEVADGYTIQTADAASASIGLEGVALSSLRPAGKGRFGPKKYDIVTRGEFIERDTPIRIIESSGNRYVVAAIEAPADENA
jgi:membrane-bound serine protease (ClpP class)